jgi:predicted acyl esterase
MNKKYSVLFTGLLFLAILSNSSTAAEEKTMPVSKPVYDFEIIYDNLTMKDGTKLSTTYFKPIPHKKDETFPVLLELLPYRKDDYFYMRDYPLYSYFARRGYVIAKVDVRGTGSSEGKVPPREYSDLELSDAVEMIDQLSKKPWSNGKVGMWGISWSGFNAIQTAMLRPRALKAIMASCATDDLYHDDVHYIDGAFHVDWYELSIDTDLGVPQSPDYVLDKDYFENRFNAYPWFLVYLHQQKDGKFWSEHSLRSNYNSINIPTYLLGGLLDGYRDSIPRMHEKMKIPLKAEIGPYNHAWPDDGLPGPNYEWRHELTRWWDYWLKNIDTGIMDEPRFTVFVRDSHLPDPYLKMTPGQFRYEDWPIERMTPKSFYPAKDNRLTVSVGETHTDTLKYVPGYGFPLGSWWGESTGDMRPADAGSLVYDSPILTETMEIVGFPKVGLKVSADAKLAHWIVRLEDVHPDGRVSLVTGAVLNGSQRDSRLDPQYLVPGETYDLNFDLHFTTWTFRPGHRIRLAVTNAQFPMIWPTPFAMTTGLFLGTEKTRLELPIIPFREPRIPAFLPSEPRESRTDAESLKSKGWPYKYDVIRDLLTDTTTVQWKAEDRMMVRGTEHFMSDINIYRANNGNPADSSYTGESVRVIRMKDRTIRLETHVSIRSDVTNFYLTFDRRIWENNRPMGHKTWKETVPREFQ